MIMMNLFIIIIIIFVTLNCKNVAMIQNFESPQHLFIYCIIRLS